MRSGLGRKGRIKKLNRGHIMATKLLSYKDLSARWQVPINTLRIWVMEKKLRPLKLGRLVRFSESYVAELETKGIR